MATDIAMDVPVAAPAERTRPKWIPYAIVGLLVVAAATWGVRRYIFSLHHVTSDNAQVDGHITTISPRISGFVARVLVDDNQHVKAGDTLVVLDDRDTKVRLQQAEADLRTAQASVTSNGRAGQAEAQLQATRAEAASAEASVAAADAAYRRATADLERYRGLAAKQIISAQQLDAAQEAAESARANLEAARKQAAAAGSQVSASGAALRGADAKLASAEAAVANARLQESYSSLIAPGERHRRTTQRRARCPRSGGPEPPLPGPRPRRVGHRQPQGDPAGASEDRGSGRVYRRCVSRPDISRKSGESESGHRRALRPPAARQRDGQLHQSRATAAGSSRG